MSSQRVILFNKPYGVLSQFTDKSTEDSPRPTLSGFIDAPVSGGQAGAQGGQLTVMCGAPRPITIAPSR